MKTKVKKLRIRSTDVRRAYVAVIDENGEHRLGISEEGSSGYFPLRDDSDLGGEYASREEAVAVARACNARIGLTEREAATIIASTLMPARRRNKAAP